jgi:hypothetical protein
MGIVGLCGVLLLVMLRSRATHFTGYCCWFMRGLRKHTLLGIVVVYARFRATHFTGHH